MRQRKLVLLLMFALLLAAVTAQEQQLMFKLSLGYDGVSVANEGIAVSEGVPRPLNVQLDERFTVQLLGGGGDVLYADSFGMVAGSFDSPETVSHVTLRLPYDSRVSRIVLFDGSEKVIDVNVERMVRQVEKRKSTPVDIKLLLLGTFGIVAAAAILHYYRRKATSSPP